MRQRNRKATEMVSRMVDMESFNKPFPSEDLPEPLRFDRQDSDEEKKNGELETNQDGLSYEDKYRELVYSIFDLCYSMVTGAGGNSNKA